MLEARQLECVRGARRLFRDVSFTVERGEAVRVAGSNGVGKTSLLRLLSGLARPESGTILFDTIPITSQREAFHAKLLFIGHSNALKDDLSPVENLQCLLAQHGLVVSAVTLRQAFARRGLAAIVDLPVKLLSQGQKRRVTLAQLEFCSSRALWLLDEPFSALDAQAVEDLAAVMASHARAGGLLLYTTHQDVDLPGARLRRLSLDA
jgi:heme exporter protein A